MTPNIEYRCVNCHKHHKGDPRLCKWSPGVRYEYAQFICSLPFALKKRTHQTPKKHAAKLEKYFAGW